jgi:hypothetical protein
MTGGWSCPHDLNGICQHVLATLCDPGMRGCVLHGRVAFASEEKNLVRRPIVAPKKPSEGKPSPPRRRLPF